MAQTRDATDNEIHAAYCAEFSRIGVDTLDKALAAARPDDPAAPKVREGRERMAHNFERFRTYVALAITRGADPVGIGLAMARAQDDWKQARQSNGHFPNGPNCGDLSWLPF
jgi:hypothetical protein